MAKIQQEVTNISDAIDRLEKAGQSKTQDFKHLLEEDVEKIKNSLKEISPYLHDLKDKVEAQAEKAKNEVETKVKDHPWAALGIVGMIAFFIGWLIGHNNRHRD